jgi:hypothetical protein
VTRWRIKAEDGEEWAITLKETMVKLCEPYTNDEEGGFKSVPVKLLQLINR